MSYDDDEKGPARNRFADLFTAVIPTLLLKLQVLTTHGYFVLKG